MIARRASKAVMRWSKPRGCPDEVSRLTEAAATGNMPMPAMGASWCRVNFMVRLMADLAGLMRSARSGPRKISRWRSPQ